LLVLGIDPGSQATGWGLVKNEGGKLRFVACGVVRCREKPMHQRLAGLLRKLHAIIKEHRPDAVAVEAIFFARNAKSALVLGQARGVALAAAGAAELPLFEYPPRAVRQAIAGDGAADKLQVQKMLGFFLGKITASADAADALAVALCHALSQGKEAVR
jgi:crossover junction endodeoxyribonuclease RuvC